MTKTRKRISVIMMLTAVILLTVGTGCKGNDPQPREKVYSLNTTDVFGVMGTATFTESGSTSTTIVVKLTGKSVIGSHPVELRKESAVENGGLFERLNPVDVNGISTTVLTNRSYTDLISLDGCIKVSKSLTEPNLLMAQGDIGGNEITNTNKSYALQGTINVSGNALFEKRVNGNTLITISVTGAIVAGDSYPATINIGSAGMVGGGPISKTLNNVVGATGKSYTNIRALDNNIPILYTDWLKYTGYINIYQTSAVIGNIICSGNIGTNVTK